jgi:hypothetical protein
MIPAPLRRNSRGDAFRASPYCVDYEGNGCFYVNYISTSPGLTRISRFSVSAGDSNVAAPGSEFMLMETGDAGAGVTLQGASESAACCEDSSGVTDREVRALMRVRVQPGYAVSRPGTLWAVCRSRVGRAE